MQCAHQKTYKFRNVCSKPACVATSVPSEMEAYTDDAVAIPTLSSASAWHYDEMSHLSIYAASKAALHNLTVALASAARA